MYQSAQDTVCIWKSLTIIVIIRNNLCSWSGHLLLLNVVFLVTRAFKQSLLFLATRQRSSY